MRIGDAYFLACGKGTVGDLLSIKCSDLISDEDVDPTILMTAIDYGPSSALASIAARVTPDIAPYSKYLVRANELQAEGLIPSDVDLVKYFAIAATRKIPPETALIQLLVRGGRLLKEKRS